MKREFSGAILEYAAGNVRRSFLLSFLFLILYRIAYKLFFVFPGDPLYVVALVTLGVSVVFFVRFLGQLIFTMLATAFGIGWHQKRLTEKQVKRSKAKDGIQSKIYFGCGYVYWKGLFMKRYLEDVI